MQVEKAWWTPIANYYHIINACENTARLTSKTKQKRKNKEKSKSRLIVQYEATERSTLSLLGGRDMKDEYLHALDTSPTNASLHLPCSIVHY